MLIDADATTKLDLFLIGPAEQKTKGRLPVRLWVENLETRERGAYNTNFQGPYQ